MPPKRRTLFALLIATLLVALLIVDLWHWRGPNRHYSPVGLHQMGRPGRTIEAAVGDVLVTLHRIRQPPPSPPRFLPAVALLNATPVPGMAAVAAWQIRPTFNPTPVGNYPVVVRRSRVEFQPNHLDEARRVATVLSIGAVRPMIKRTYEPAEKADVAVVIGTDRACRRENATQPCRPARPRRPGA